MPLIFQFQYGTIKSFGFEREAISPTLFQFQYGTIKRHAEHRSKEWLQISIPVWYD